MRGVVSPAAALSIPLLARDNQAFPYRNLILFITFIVILITLVFQGLTLPWIIRELKPRAIGSAMPDHEQEMDIQRKIAVTSIKIPGTKNSGWRRTGCAPKEPARTDEDRYAVL